MTNSGHIEVLKQGVEQWNRWKSRHPEVYSPDLRECDLRGANLSGANSVELTSRGLSSTHQALFERISLPRNFAELTFGTEISESGLG